MSRNEMVASELQLAGNNFEQFDRFDWLRFQFSHSRDNFIKAFRNKQMQIWRCIVDIFKPIFSFGSSHFTLLAIDQIIPRHFGNKINKKSAEIC